MATAAGIPDHIAATARSTKNMEDCWESPAWDQTDNRTESHGTESGEFSADRTMEWVFKSAPWDLDSLLVFPPRLRDADKRLPNNDTSFPAFILEASVPAEEYGQKQRLDRSLIQRNSSFDSRGCKGEVNGAIGPSNSGRHSDLKPSQAEQRSLPSTELASCSLSSGHSLGVFSRAQSNLKKDRGETQLMSTGGNYPHKLSLVYGRDVVTEKRRGRNEDAQSNGVNVEASTDSVIGLKLGKRTYYKDSAGYVSGKTPTIISPSPPSYSAKKQRAQSQSAQIPRCQVEGCDLDLSSVKDYHRRHKVCDTHSKSPRVTVAGQEQRFCQQCSRLSQIFQDFNFLVLKQVTSGNLGRLVLLNFKHLLSYRAHWVFILRLPWIYQHTSISPTTISSSGPYHSNPVFMRVCGCSSLRWLAGFGFFTLRIVSGLIL